jgi:hypothetical protein
VALVSGGVPGVVICTRIAEELGRTAIDFGHCLNYLVNPLFNERTLIHEKLRWRLGRYVERHLGEAAEHVDASSRDGTFVRTENGRIYYIENGYKRHVPSRAILDAFDVEPTDVAGSELSAMPIGLPFFLVVDEVGGAFLIKDGLRWGVDVTGLQTIGIDSQVLASLDCAPTRLKLAPQIAARPGRTDSQ